MTGLDDWAERHAIGPQALADLRRVLAGQDATFCPAPERAGSEAYVQSAVRLEAARKGVHLWRNNVGACTDQTGRLIRYGLANESKAQNERVKSSDLIGVRPVVVTQAHVGQTIGQFVARECKAAGWNGPPRNDHERAQARFLNIVTACGGDAAFASSEGTL